MNSSGEGGEERTIVSRGVVGWGRGASTVKSPVGISTVSAALEDRRGRLRLLQAELVAAVADPEDTPESAVTAAGQGEEAFFLRQGQRGDDERWPTTLQVRHVFGERIHQACTFSPKSSKSVGASRDSPAGVLIIKSHLRVIH